MIATLASALAVVLSTMLAGQLICAVCGARRWTPAAPAVGLSALMLIAVTGLHLPGRMTLPFLVTVALSVAGAALMVRRADHRPPAGAGLAALLTLLVTLVPFFAQRRFGVLGVSFNNDMGLHLAYAGSFRDASLEAAAPLLDYYPFGPHALVAELGHGMGLGLDGVFTGLTLAMPVLTATIAYGLLRRAGWLGAAVASVFVGMQYLSAAYLGEGAFKEVMYITLLLGTVALLVSLREGVLTGWARLVPLGIVIGGVLSMYSIAGLAWIGATIALVALAAAVPRLRSGGSKLVIADVRGLVLPAVAGGAVLVVAMAPQLPRLHAFWRYMHETGSGTGIAKDDIGNLAGPLQFLESTGIWLSADFRYAPLVQTASTLLGLLVLAGAAWGAVRLVRRGEREVVIAAGVCLLLAAWSAHSQSPYTTAKAFVITSPFLILLAAFAFLEQRRDPVLVRGGRVTVAVGLACVAAVSSFLTLRYLPVGPRTHEQQLAAFRPLVEGKKVLYLGNDEFGQWYLSGAAVAQPTFASGRRDVGAVTTLPTKTPGIGQGYDWDSFGRLDRWDDVVMPDDASGSEKPPNFRLIARSGPWDLFERTGPSRLRGVLSDEHEGPGQPLDCQSPEGRVVLHGGGTAGIRTAPVRVMSAAVPQGTSVDVPVPLTPGRWLVNVAYAWQAPVHLRGAGLATTLPASLDRQGPRYPAGTVRVARTGNVVLNLAAGSTRLRRPGLAMAPVELSFTPVGTERTVPVRQACGKYLDWYEPHAG